ncbi:MAG: IS1595 family transposase [Lutibacter sp.]|jgi:transposase-like protein
MNLLELSNKFPNELEAIKFFEKARWGKIVKCPFCGSIVIGNRNADYRWHCKNCDKSFSVTTGTILHNTRLGLKTWLYAFGVISDAKKGLSAMQLQRNLGVHYETAWTMYHKIRDIMSIENDKIRLDGIVELDTKQMDVSMRKCQAEKKGTPKVIPELDKAKTQFESKGFEFKEGDYKKPCKIGKQKPGLGASDLKMSGVVERNGYVVAEVIKNTTYSELKKIINKHVDKRKSKTVLMTDEGKGNLKFKTIMNQIIIDHKKLYSYKGLNTNTIESFWAFIERQVVGQHHHVDLEYLDKYLAETVFKFNNRKVDDMFETLVKLSMTKQ